MSEITRLKVDLLCKGIRVDPNAPYSREIVPEKYAEGGKSRAGVAGSGKSFILGHQEPCNIGVLQPFLEESPYQFMIIDNQGWILKNGEKVSRATLREPAWHSTPYSNQIQLHGKDSLATALSNFCTYKKQGQGCKFCIIDVGREVIFHHPQQIARSIESIEENPDLRACFDIEDKYNPDLTDKEILTRKQYVEPKDININAGALKNAAKIYGNTISEIRKVSKLPIFIEIGPLTREEMEGLHSAGTDAVSFNLEVYDQKMRDEVIPGKAKKNPLEMYLSSMSNAVDVFGENQVSSWILIGLEPPEKTIEGIRKIAETGAIPLPKPFRPLYGADYEKKRPPRLEDAVLIYEEWLDTVRECGLNPLKSKAGCARCNACFPLKELLKYGI
ncbi:MAG: hypothetical protein LUQ70_03580 [Methanobacteriaceae archaeon]|nr:hypothetical protein [Methanobacteriaceae archaeon]